MIHIGYNIKQKEGINQNIYSINKKLIKVVGLMGNQVDDYNKNQLINYENVIDGKRKQVVY